MFSPRRINGLTAWKEADFLALTVLSILFILSKVLPLLLERKPMVAPLKAQCQFTREVLAFSPARFFFVLLTLKFFVAQEDFKLTC